MERWPRLVVSTRPLSSSSPFVACPTNSIVRWTSRRSLRPAFYPSRSLFVSTHSTTIAATNYSLHSHKQQQQWQRAFAGKAAASKLTSTSTGGVEGEEAFLKMSPTDVRVIIAEKQMAADSIARALGIDRSPAGTYEKTGKNGEKVIVTYASGHLMQLPDTTDKWLLDTLPLLPDMNAFEPEAPSATDDYRKMRLHAIASLLRSATDIVNACDAGREGELIFRDILTVDPAYQKKQLHRLWISSLTTDAILQGFKELRPLNEFDQLYKAAAARRQADWLVGINATRVFTLKARGLLPKDFDKVVHLGRVQTPVLRLIVERTSAVENFKPEPYWEVELECKQEGKPDEPITLKYYRGSAAHQQQDTTNDEDESSHDSRFKRLEDAQKVIDSLKDNCTVVSNKQSTRQEKPPKLHSLTTLQEEMNTRYGLSASDTLACAQSLYLKGLITYPRTGSAYLAPDLMPQINVFTSLLEDNPKLSDLVRNIRESKAYSTSNKAIFNVAKVTDHHAIIPTTKYPSSFEFTALNEEERNVYLVLVTRFLAAFMPNCERTVNELIVVNGDKHHFRGRSTSISVHGWRSASTRVLDAFGRSTPPSSSPAPGEDKAASAEMPRLQKGDKLTCGVTGNKPIEKATTPPSYFTDGTLLRLMETAGKLLDNENDREALAQCGLGTPATRASTIERLTASGYVQRHGRHLVATPKANAVIPFVEKSTISSPQLTGEWERRLRSIEESGADDKVFLKDIRDYVTDFVNIAKLIPTPAYVPYQRTKVEGDDLATATATATPKKLARNKPTTPVAEEEVDASLPCRHCGNNTSLESHEAAWKCSNASCTFSVPKTYFDRPISQSEAHVLQKLGTTSKKLSGFYSHKKGKFFSGQLTLDDKHRLAFIFT